MNRLLIRSVFVFASFLMIFQTSAQTNQEASNRRNCLMKSISLLDEYEYYSLLNDKDDETEMKEGFRALFAEGAVIYNDLLGFSNSTSLSVDDYIRLLTSSSKNTTILIKNINKESIEHDGDVWRTIYTLDKEVSYTDPCGVLLSSKMFFEKDYKLRVFLVYKPTEQSCKIEKIDGFIDSDKTLSTNYSAIQTNKKSSKYDRKVEYDGKNLDFNDYGQALISENLVQEKLHYPDMDVSVKTKVDPNCNRLTSIDYHRHHFRIKPTMDMAMTYMGTKGPLSSVKGSNTSYGLDLGYALPSSGKTKVIFFTGFAATNARLEMNFTSSDYQSDSQVTFVGSTPYTVHFENVNITQSYKDLKYYTIPVYINIDRYFTEIVGLYIDFGAKINLAQNGVKFSLDNANAYVYASVPGEDSERVTTGYGFGSQTFGTENIYESDVAQYKHMVIDAFAGLGVKVAIPKTPIAFDLGARYQMGLTPMLESYNYNSSMTTAPISMIQNYGITAVNIPNYVNLLGDIKAKNLMLHVAITCKF